MSNRPSVYDYAGGVPAFAALATALHERCLEDPVLNHPFSHDLSPEHLDHLAGYLGEVFGGPPAYSTLGGGHAAMLLIHSHSGAQDDMPTRFVTCFDLAADDAGLPTDPEFRLVLHDYIVWATNEVHSYSPHDSIVPQDAAFPHWSWSGLET
jgi:hemoglobin